MYKKIITAFFILICSADAFSQSVDSLKKLIPAIQRGSTDVIRKEANDKFLEGFKQLLLEKESFNENFDSLKNVSVLFSEDKKLRIYTWLLPYYDGNTYDYFGFLHYKDQGIDTLYQLKDSTQSIQKPESEKLSPEKWIGAVYYKIIQVKKNKSTFYTLLGWKAKDNQLTQKIIEILYFDKNKARFGYPLIKSGSVFKNRMIFTFNAQITMSLNYNSTYGGIVFDHLGTNKNNLSQINGPDGTYDGLKFKKGKWTQYHDIDIRTKWKPKEGLPEPTEKLPEQKE